VFAGTGVKATLPSLVTSGEVGEPKRVALTELGQVVSPLAGIGTEMTRPVAATVEFPTNRFDPKIRWLSSWPSFG
jgi:hypothetical protein